MVKQKTQIFQGPVLVGLAALLWATDGLVRYPATGSLDPTLIVFVEHVLAILILGPWIALKYRQQLFSLNLKEWFAAIFCGGAGSALALLFFTASFKYINPSVSVLLQKLQPMMVVVIAYFLLGERPSKKFYIWGGVALVAGIILSCPDLDFKFVRSGLDLHSLGIRYALGASFIWAASTVSSKVLLKRTPPTLATFWRFFFGLISITLLLSLTHQSLRWEVFRPKGTFFFLAYLSLIPGLWAMLVYYSGLARTPAIVTTFIELLYPILAIVLHTVFLHTPLQTTETIAGVVLLFAVTMLSL